MDDREWMYTAGPVGVTRVMNGLRRPMLSWIEPLLRLKERVPIGVPTAVVQIGIDKQRRSWVNIFARMALRQTIPGGRTMEKLII